jgi:hypothetical protein
MPVGTPTAAAPATSELNDVGAPPAQRAVHESPSAHHNSQPASEHAPEQASVRSRMPTSTVAAQTGAGLPQRIRRLGPVDTDKILPTGPVANMEILHQSPAQQLQQQPHQPTMVHPAGPAQPIPAQPIPAQSAQSIPAQPTPNDGHLTSLIDEGSVGPTPIFATHKPAPEPMPTLDPNVVAGVATTNSGNTFGSTPGTTSRSPLGLTSLAPVGFQVPVEVFPNAPKARTVRRDDPNDAYDFNNPDLSSGRPAQPVTMVFPTGASAGSALEAHAPYVANVALEESPTLGVIDWRLMALAGLLAAYLPLLVRSLLGVRLSSPIGMSVLAGLMVPLSIIVVAARRPRQPKTDDRYVDLALGTLLGGASLVTAFVLPRTLGGGVSMWRTEWLSLPIALFAAYVLLWGVHFAWDLRNSLWIAALTSPILFVPLLGQSWSPLSGDINPLSITIANGLAKITQSGYATYVADKTQTEIDARGLVDGRMLSIVLCAILIALVLVSRVDERTTGRGASGKSSGFTRRWRKLAVLGATLGTFWIVDLIISALAIGLCTFVPVSMVRYVTSPVVGALPTFITAYLFLGWARRFRLFLPSKLGVLNSATRLPAHGPKSRIDHAITVVVLVFLGVSAVLNGLKPHVQTTANVSDAVDLGATYAPPGWQASAPVELGSFHAYFGAHSTWVRTGLTPAVADIDQVNVDKVSAPIDLLRTFEAPSTYQLGLFQPVDRQTIEVGNGQSAVQETYYDTASASTWSIVSVLVENATGTHRISISGRAAGDVATVPLPAPQALANLTMRTAKLVPGPGQELKISKIASTNKAVADLMRVYILQMSSGATTDTSSAPAVLNDIVVDDGFVQ